MSDSMSLRTHLHLQKKPQQQQSWNNSEHSKYPYISYFLVHKHIWKSLIHKNECMRKKKCFLHCIALMSELYKEMGQAEWQNTTVTQSINTNKTNVCTYFIISCTLVLYKRAWRSMAGRQPKWAFACSVVTVERCFSSFFRNISTPWDLQPFRQLVPVVHCIHSLFTTLGSETTLLFFLKQPHIPADHYHMSYSPFLLGLNSLQFFWSVLTDTFVKFLIVPTALLWRLFSPNCSWKLYWKPAAGALALLNRTKEFVYVPVVLRGLSTPEWYFLFFPVPRAAQDPL